MKSVPKAREKSMPGDQEKDREARQGDPVGDEGLSDIAKAYQKAGPYLSASTTLVVAVAGGALGGWWLDGKLGNHGPWLLLTGFVVGMVVGFVGFFSTVLKAGKKK